MERRIPVDVHAVQQYGIERWLDDHFWPVAEPEFGALCERIEQCIARHITTGPPVVSDALLVKRSLPVEYWHFLHAVIVLDRLNRSSMEPMVSDTTSWFRMLRDGTFDAHPNGMLGRSLAAAHEQRARVFDTARWKRVAWEVRMNTVAGKWSWSSGTHSTAASFGVPPTYVSTYIARLPHRLSVTAWCDWFPSPPPLGVGAREELRAAASVIADELRTIARMHGVELTAAHIEFLNRCTERQLSDAAVALAGISLRILGADDAFIFSMPGNQFQRAIALAARAHGTRVMSFAHSGSLAFFDSYSMSVNEFALSDEFVTLTTGTVPLFERILAAHPPLRGSRVRIVPGTCDDYVTMWERSARTSMAPRVRRVMLIGFPHAPWRKPQGAGLFWFSMLDLELRLVRTLQEFGYDVTYKAHPDRLREAKGLFGDRVRILGGDLRDAIDRADAFVSSSVRTTAFHLALCTQKSVVGLLVEPDRYPMFPDVRARLEQRCTLLTLRYDERDRLAFDREALHAALARPPVAPDRSFLDAYLMPYTCAPASSS